MAIDTKLTRIENENGEWRDGGGVPLGFREVLRAQPELMSDAELARIIAQISGKGHGVLAITGVSSSGLLTLKEERASLVDKFEVLDFRLMHGERDLDRAIDRDSVKQGMDREGNYLAFTVPANATIDVINRWLTANYPEFSLDVEVTTHTSSGVGANILTGLLGENRRPVEAEGLTVIVNGEVKEVRGKETVDAYRGTQGYAGIVKKVRVLARLVPENPGMLLLPLRGNDLESTFATSYAQVLATLAPWIYSEVGGTRLATADILDISGLQTIHRVTAPNTPFEIPGFLADQFDEDHHSVICMRTQGPVALIENEALLTAIMALNEQGLVGEVKPLDKPLDISPVIARRGQVPERAREEAGHEGRYSVSMDLDTKILFGSLGVNFSESSVQQAYVAAYAAIIRAYRPLEEVQAEGVYLTWNGHFYPTNVKDHYVGGHNPHLRLTGPEVQRALIAGAKRSTTEQLIALHGKKFGPFTIAVQEGEKHYPSDALALEHFAKTQPRLAAQRARLTQAAGLLHNARVPEAYAEMMKQVGHPLTS